MEDSIYEQRQFMIFPVTELYKINFDEVLETSEDTVRKSVDGTKTFVKWDGNVPSFIYTLLNTEGPYTYTQIIEILDGVEWTNKIDDAI